MFLDIAKFDDFRWKNTDVSRIQGVCHVIDIFLDLLWVRYNCAKFHHWRICVTDFREGGAFLFRPHPWAAPKKPTLNRFKRINWFLFPLKSSENHMFSDDFTAKRSHGKKSLIQSRFKSRLFGLHVFFDRSAAAIFDRSFVHKFLRDLHAFCA